MSAVGYAGLVHAPGSSADRLLGRARYPRRPGAAEATGLEHDDDLPPGVLNRGPAGVRTASDRRFST